MTPTGPWRCGVPANEVALELLGEIGPMAVTSANTTGDPAARTVDDAVAMLGESIAVYLDAGASSDGEASTIIDCTGEAPVTLRLGAIAQEVIDAALVPDEADSDAAESGSSAGPGAGRCPHVGCRGARFGRRPGCDPTRRPPAG